MSGSFARLTMRRIPDFLTKDQDTAQFMQGIIDQLAGSSGGGVSTFQALTDAFTFLGNGGRSLRVNAGATALEPFDETVSARFTSLPQTINVSTTLTIAHGLTVTPVRLFAYLVNVTPELGYIAGDVIACPTAGDIFTSATPALFRIGATFQVDATNITIVFASGSGGGLFYAVNKATFATTFITNGSWNLFVIAEP